MQLRIARHTERLPELVAFYRDGIGLVEIGTFEDHDGFRVVLVPEPWRAEAPTGAAVAVTEHVGSRVALRALFELAEDSADELDRYIDAGRLIVASDGPRIVGHLQVTDTGRPDEAEIKNMAVAPSHQGR